MADATTAIDFVLLQLPVARKVWQSISIQGLEEAEEFSTLVHELAHLMLRHGERRTETTKTGRETEAEAVAFVVGKSIGLTTSTASADYIGLYHGSAALLAESLELVQRTSAVILAGLRRDEAAPQEVPEAMEAEPEAKRVRRFRDPSVQ